MNKKIAFSIGTGLFVAPLFASAETLLRGAFDTSIRTYRIAGSRQRTEVSGNGTKTSNVNFSITEKIDEDLEFSGELEAGVNPGTGETKWWDRKSYVSLRHRKAGTFGLGLRNTPTNAALIQGPFGANGVGSSSNIVSRFDSGTNSNFRTPEAAFYESPVMNGTSVLLMTSRTYEGVGINYTDAHWKVVAAGALTEGAKGNYRIGTLAATYVSDGGAKVSASFVDAGYLDRHQLTYSAGLAVPYGFWTAKVGGSYADMRGSASTPGYRRGDDAVQWTIGGQYDMSARLALYATYNRLINKGLSLASMSSVPGVPGRNQDAAEVGLRFNF